MPQRVSRVGGDRFCIQKIQNLFITRVGIVSQSRNVTQEVAPPPSRKDFRFGQGWPSSGVLVGALGRYRFLFDVSTSEGPFVAPNEPILTLLDTFPDATDPGNTLRHFLLRVDEYKPDISGTGKI